MLETIFRGVFDTQLTNTITPEQFLLCVGASLVIGLVLCVLMLWHARPSAGFAITLATLPAVVCVVIMMVNGNVGAGVAVAGAFSLVRFRSAPGSAREIGAIFAAMGAGLMAGMGYLGYAVLFTLILGGVTMAYHVLGFGGGKNVLRCRTLHITIPEDLDAQVFVAGAKLEDGVLKTSGGRVLGVTAVGDTLASAIDSAYRSASHVSFQDMHFRTDIGRTF